MAKMRIQFIRWSDLLIGAMLTLLGFSSGSCSKDNEDVKDEYGCPSADYKVIGKVVSSANQTTISNIQVKFSQLYYETDSLGDAVEYVANTVMVYTNDDGSYEVEMNTVPDSEIDFRLSVSDIDGDENGTFATKDSLINIKDDELSGGSGWYLGSATKEINVELDPE